VFRFFKPLTNYSMILRARPPGVSWNISFGIALGLALAFYAGPSVAWAEDVPAESVAANAFLSPGMQVHSQPPAGFDPLTASDLELQRFGFPPRPDARATPQQYAIWKKMVTAPQTRIVPSVEQTTIHNQPIQFAGRSAAGNPTNGTTQVASLNWSGFAVVDANKPFASGTTVFGEYIVPIAQQAFGTCNGGWDYSAEWVGLDGVMSNDVLQAGIEDDAFCSGSSKKTFYKSWFEWFPNPSFRIKNLVIKPGNVVGVAVWNTSPTQANALIIDYTTQKAVSVAFNAPNGTVLTGDSVEWIVERPEVNGTLATLTNYVADPFNFCEAAVGAAAYGPGASPTGATYSVNMLDASNAVLSFADAYGASTLWFYEPGTAASP